MSGLLDGQVALVTGAGGGIGQGIAARFAEEGAAVALHCRTAREAADRLAGRIREAGGRAGGRTAGQARAVAGGGPGAGGPRAGA
ncbi:SDR family NAD(P)-dependent oxidoreductase, partial [Streptomyces sp. NPDC059374]|uniref:SDR family NAD(P)-dependent oxidoreductase n=1 Tax=Streptomyces sp. NPDC059374 TaxID=3346814 RepID=UPI0036796A02